MMEKLKTYLPLIIMLLVSVAMALATAPAGLSFGDRAMGFFLIFLSVFKMIDWRGFAKSFARYDWLGARLPAYAMAYPLIELLLGLGYIGGFYPLGVNILMLLVALQGMAGVFIALREKKALTCACAGTGTGFKLPVGRVTLVEYGAMAAMAAMNLAMI